MAEQRLFQEEKDGILLVTINRAESLNAYDTQMITEWEKLVETIPMRKEIRALIITGTGNAFCVGADLKERKDLPKSERIRTGKRYVKVLNSLENIPQVVIAAINGFAMGGGCELCLVSDIRIASEKAEFGLPEVKVGIVPGAGGTLRLPRLVGKGMAKEIIFTGRRISAREAKEIGLVERLVEHNRLLEEAWQLAEEICTNAPLAITLAKQSINLGTEVGLHTAFAYEEKGKETLLASEDYLEGITAFKEKRKPQFKGK